jgi:hypothetical protein
VQARFTALAIEPDGRGPADFRRLIESDVMRCAKLRRKRTCDSNNV